MENDTLALIVGITFGLAVVGVVAVFIMLAKNSTPALALSAQTYSNEEKWDVVKDANGRVKTIVVHREATAK